MGNLNGKAGTRRSKTGTWAGSLVVLAAILTGCPLPFQFSRQGWSGNASAVDPSTPDVTAGPTLTYTQSAGGSGGLTTGQTVTTSSDTMIELVTETPGAVIYYSTDGSTPDPRSAQTSQFSSGTPITLSIPSPSVSNSSKSLTIKATAIGPNMKPSLVTSATVTLQYPQAAAPVFSVPGGFYSGDQSVTLSSSTSGATIYYTQVNGPGPAPRPVPGQPGTLTYTGPLVLPGPLSTTAGITAIAVKAQLIESASASASYSTIALSQIIAADPTMTSTAINNSDGSVLPVGEVILYNTSSGHYGAMVITNNNSDGNHGILFNFTTYDTAGNVLATGTNVQCRGTYLFDLDAQPNGLEGTGAGMDFWMENVTGTNRAFQPTNGARFVLNGLAP